MLAPSSARPTLLSPLHLHESTGHIVVRRARPREIEGDRGVEVGGQGVGVLVRRDRRGRVCRVRRRVLSSCSLPSPNSSTPPPPNFTLSWHKRDVSSVLERHRRHRRNPVVAVVVVAVSSLAWV